MKKVISLCLVLVVLLGATVLPASAGSPLEETQGNYYTTTDPNTGLTQQIPMTYWSYMSNVIHGVVDLGDGSVDVVSDATLYNRSYKVTVKATLQKKNSNGTWSSLKSFSGTKQFSVSICESYKIASSGYYRTATAFTVYDTAGRAVESDTIYSNSTYVWK